MEDAERAHVAARLTDFWSSHRMVSRGRVHHPGELPAFVAEHGGRVVGVLAYDVRGGELECASVTAFQQGLGAGSALMEAGLDGIPLRDEVELEFVLDHGLGAPASRKNGNPWAPRRA